MAASIFGQNIEIKNKIISGIKETPFFNQN